MPFITFFTSTHYVGAVILSTVGTISDIYTHSSVTNKICITDPINQVANVIDPHG
jgi:hypothetical protein